MRIVDNLMENLTAAFELMLCVFAIIISVVITLGLIFVVGSGILWLTGVDTENWAQKAQAHCVEIGGTQAFDRWGTYQGCNIEVRKGR